MTTTNDQPPKRHVAVCAFPFGSHAAPLLLLVKQISTIARDTRFTFFNTERSNASLFKSNDVKSFSNIVPYDITLPESQPTQQGNPMMKAIENFLEFSPTSFRRALAEVEAQVGIRLSCLISDAFLWFCGDIGQELGLSWIALWTAGPVSLSTHFYTDFIRNKFGGDVQQATEDGKDLLQSIPGLSNIRINDLPMGIVSGDLKAPFSQMLHNMALMIPKAKAVALNCFQELSPIVVNDLNSKMRLLCVGPFPLTYHSQADSDPYNCLEWLDKHDQKKVAYISFGTFITPPPHEIKALAEALEVSGIPFLWSMNDSSKGNLPQTIMERIQDDEKIGKIVPWAPQMKILTHPSVGVFVMHGGWNSMMESILTGVPLICRPVLGDQMLNQRVIETNLKVGIGIEGGELTQSGTINALNQVLFSDEGKKMRKNVEELKILAEESIKPGGSSFKNFNVLIEHIIRS